MIWTEFISTFWKISASYIIRLIQVEVLDTIQLHKLSDFTLGEEKHKVGHTLWK